MGSTFGKNIKISLYGESHGSQMGIVIDGLPSGFKIDEEDIKEKLSMRRPNGKTSTTRIEKDEYQITSGYFNGYTTGAPLHISIKNEDTISKVYDKDMLRPSHVDYTAHLKYRGYQDYRGSGHFSGRVTTCIVLAGTIIRQLLRTKDIVWASHIIKLHQTSANIYSSELDVLEKEVEMMSHASFAILNDPSKYEEMILDARNKQDSIGGVIETAILNYPKGMGEPFFDSIESTLSQLLFSVPAVKGVSFGLGFDFSDYYASEVNDEWIIKNEAIVSKTNNNGGINGGISNGMPIIINSVVKPTPSISKPQASVNYQTRQEEEIIINGRHDPCILSRVSVVIDSIIAFGLIDLYLEEYGRQAFYD